MSKKFGTYVLQNIYRSNPWNSAALLEGCSPEESHILIVFLILSCSQKMKIWSIFLRCALLVNVEDGKKDSEKSLSNQFVKCKLEASVVKSLMRCMRRRIRLIINKC